MEVNNLPDTEFKTMDKSILRELRENFNSMKEDIETMKKNQSEMKNTISEMKNKVVGISDFGRQGI